MQKLFMILALFGLAVSATACNMLRGAGRDIEKVGDSIQDAAN